MIVDVHPQTDTPVVKMRVLLNYLSRIGGHNNLPETALPSGPEVFHFYSGSSANQAFRKFRLVGIKRTIIGVGILVEIADGEVRCEEIFAVWRNAKLRNLNG